MDRNKLRVLRAVEYIVQPCCGLCRHGHLAGELWGECRLHTYEHVKHKRTMQLSIHAFGICSQFVESDERAARLGGFDVLASRSGRR